MSKAMRFNIEKPKLSRIFMGMLIPLAEVLTFGAAKYEWDNWKEGMDRNDILDSLTRHLHSMIDGELYDKDSGLHHIGHILANVMFYWYHFGVKEGIYKNTKTKFYENLEQIKKKYKKLRNKAKDKSES